MNEDKLLDHHIIETRLGFSEVRDDLKDVKREIQKLSEFRIETITMAKSSAKWVSLIVSGVVGVIFLIINSLVTYFSNK